MSLGYIIGSGWKDYQASGKVCGITLPEGLQQADKLNQPIFTPAFKAEQGEHDENNTYEKMEELIGSSLAAKLKEISLQLYNFGRDFREKKE